MKMDSKILLDAVVNPNDCQDLLSGVHLWHWYQLLLQSFEGKVKSLTQM